MAVPAADSTEAPLDLTFGIEMECMVLLNTFPNAADSIEDDMGMRIVHELLTKPMTARCAICKQDHTLTLPLNDFGKDARNNNDPGYKNWSVEQDISVRLSDKTKDKFTDELRHTHVYPVEIISRVLSANCNFPTTPGEDHVHEVSWKDEIGAICQSLKEGLNSPTTGSREARILINDSCGFHVHLGNHDKGFPLPTVKNILSLCLANEKIIDSMHTTARITGSTLAVEERPSAFKEVYRHQLMTADSSVSYCNLPWSTHLAHSAYAHANHQLSEVAKQTYPNNKRWKYRALDDAVEKYDVASQLTVIRYAESMSDLLRLHGQHVHDSNINLQNHQKDFAPKGSDPHDLNWEKMTIEFRQHAGTRDTREMFPWIEFLLSLAQFAHTYSQAEVRKLCLEQWNNPQHKLSDLLRTLDVPAPARSHYKRVLGRSQGNLSWANEFEDEERNIHLSYSTSSPATAIITQIISENSRQRAPENVRQRIQEKFLAGGYGQYSEDYLGEFDIDDDLRERLTLGWKASYRDSDDDDDKICLMPMAMEEMRHR